MPSQSTRRAAFLDRDGVLNEDAGYVGTIERFRWISGAKEAVSFLHEKGYLVFVVTNQSGVARGFFDEAAVHALHAHMQSELQAIGTRIDAFRYCPHHENALVASYRLNCSCRKPAPGHILSLIEEFELAKTGSFMIGDKASDMRAAVAAGIDGHLFSGGSLLAFVTQIVGRDTRAGPLRA